MIGVKEEQEQSRLIGINIGNLLNKGFLDKLQGLNIKIDPAAIILVAPKDKNLIPISLSHKNSKEFEEKILHISCPDAEIFEKIKKILKDD